MDKIDLDIPEVRLDLPKDWDNLDLLDLKVEPLEVLLDNIDIEHTPINQFKQINNNAIDKPTLNIFSHKYFRYDKKYEKRW